MANYQHAGPAKGECYGTRPSSPGADARTKLEEAFKYAYQRCPKDVIDDLLKKFKEYDDARTQPKSG